VVSSNGEIIATGEACDAMPFFAGAYARAPRDLTPRLKGVNRRSTPAISVKMIGMNAAHPGLELLIRVGLATLLGFAIGLERQWRSRMAGLQTMALVSMGSALFTELGVYGFPQEDDRVAAQIVTGIGFLGAGVIIKTGMTVAGLNTAATLWATAAVGALCGVWMWREAVVGAVIIVTANGLLFPLAKWIDRRPQRPGRGKHADF
jgi:putative Mg2+ transporter-C (MgtC) family protein